MDKQMIKVTKVHSLSFMVTCTIPSWENVLHTLRWTVWNVYMCRQFLEDWGLFQRSSLKSQMSFAFQPGCVLSSFGSTSRFFPRHPGLDETLTDGGLDWGKFHFTDSWIRQKKIQNVTVGVNKDFYTATEPKKCGIQFAFSAKDVSAIRLGSWMVKSFPIGFWQTRFWSFFPSFRMGLKGMSLTWMKVSWQSACRLAADAAKRTCFLLAKYS